MATLPSSTSQDPISTRDPSPPGSWPEPVLGDGSDAPAQQPLSPQPQTTDAAFPSTNPTSTAEPQADPSITDNSGSRVFRTHHDRSRNRNTRPHRGRYEPSHPTYRLTREQLREIAEITLNKLDSGFYVPPPFKTRAQAEEEAKLKAIEVAEAEARAREREEEEERKRMDALNASDPSTSTVEESNPEVDSVDQDRKQSQDTEGNNTLKDDEAENQTKEPVYSYAYDLLSKMQYTNTQTEFYASDNSFISDWSSIAKQSAESFEDAPGSDPHPQSRSSTKTRILIREYSTLVGARRLHALNRRKQGKNAVLQPDESVDDAEKIGVLNFASAKKPGGGFISGAQAQEESLARSSTLFPSLITPTSSPFYEHYQENKDSPTISYYTHAMIYSPSVVLFRNDKGHWLSPLEVDILTSAAVNAGEVRERIKYEEQLREVRERWQEMVAERKKFEEEKRQKEQEEWEAVLKDNEELKRRYGEDDSNQSGGNALSPTHDPVDKSFEDKIEVKDHQAGITSESSDTTANATSSSTQADDQSTEPTPSSEAQQEMDDAPPQSTPSASVDPIVSEELAEPTTTPSEPKPDPLALAEIEIEAQMKERIARILALFASPRDSSGTQSPVATAKPRARHLILGSFGTGVFQNHVPLVARIFYDLLARRGAPFAGIFDTVVFAILGTGTVNVFREVFSGKSQDGVQDGELTQIFELDERVEVVLEGQDEHENALEMEEEIGCEEEGLLRVVEKDATADEAHLFEPKGSEGNEADVEDGRVVAIDIDEVEAEAREIEMGDDTHDPDHSTEHGYTEAGGHGVNGNDDGNGDVEMLDTATEDVRVQIHPLQLVDGDPTSLPTHI